MYQLIPIAKNYNFKQSELNYYTGQYDSLVEFTLSSSFGP